MSQRVWRPLAILTVAAVFAFAAPVPSASACPNCKDNVAANDQATASKVGNGFSYSVLFMMAMPFVLAGGFGVACWMHFRNAAQPAQAGSSASHGQPSASAGPDEPGA